MINWICYQPPGTRNKTRALHVLLIMLLLAFKLVSHSVEAQEKSNTKTLNTQSQKTETQKTENNKKKELKKTDSEQDIDWGGWDAELPDVKSDNSFGVGIQGQIEAELSRIDKSNLLQNATGVATTAKANNTGTNKKPKDLKKTMAELEALEAKVKKEIEDDSEF